MTGPLQRLKERHRERKRVRELARAAFRFDRAENPEPYRAQMKRFLITLPLVGALGSTIPLLTLGPDFIWLGVAPLAVHLTIGTQANRLVYLYRVEDGATALQQDPQGTLELLSQQCREIER